VQFLSDSPALLQSRLAPKERQVSYIKSYQYEDTHSQEDEDVTFGLCRVNLEDRSDGCVKVISFGLRRIMDIDRIATTGNCQSDMKRLGALQV
jgi:hypothetical protein